MCPPALADDRETRRADKGVPQGPYADADCPCPRLNCPITHQLELFVAGPSYACGRPIVAVPLHYGIDQGQT